MLGSVTLTVAATTVVFSIGSLVAVGGAAVLVVGLQASKVPHMLARVMSGAFDPSKQSNPNCSKCNDLFATARSPSGPERHSCRNCLKNVCCRCALNDVVFVNKHDAPKKHNHVPNDETTEVDEQKQDSPTAMREEQTQEAPQDEVQAYTWLCLTCIEACFTLQRPQAGVAAVGHFNDGSGASKTIYVVATPDGLVTYVTREWFKAYLPQVYHNISFHESMVDRGLAILPCTTAKLAALRTVQINRALAQKPLD